MLSNVIFCQVNSTQFCIGKFYNEVRQCTYTTPTTFGGRKALYNTALDNLTIYVFNNDICVEYDAYLKNNNLDSIENSVKEYISYNPSIRFFIRKIDSNFTSLIIRKD